MATRPLSLAAFLTICVSLSGCSGLWLFGERDDFVRVRGQRLVHNGRPYYFAGANMWYALYLGSPRAPGQSAPDGQDPHGKAGEPHGREVQRPGGPSRDRLCRELDTLRANGVLNLRLLAASEDPYMPRSVRPAVQRRPGELDEELLQGLDFALAEMADRGMHAVLYLNNYWEWSGGMVQYNVWAGREPVVPGDSPEGWARYMDFAADFYADTLANRMYRDYVRVLVTRRNTVNGRLYAEDPAIMAWQLANEPRPGTVSPRGQANLPAYYAWVEGTAAYIHSLDTNHLVSTGSEGTVGSLLSARNYLAAHRSSHVDYLTFHLWPQNWGIYDPKNAAATLPAAETHAVAYIDTHLALARELNKPIVLEEFGLGRDGGSVEPASGTTMRDRYYGVVLSTLCDSARAGAPVAGFNFWAWAGEGRAASDSVTSDSASSDPLRGGSTPGAERWWRPGDPFLGDPPQEPQGLNSVFDTDRTTRAVIRDHALRMSALQLGDSLLAERR